MRTPTFKIHTPRVDSSDERAATVSIDLRDGSGGTRTARVGINVWRNPDGDKAVVSFVEPEGGIVRATTRTERNLIDAAYKAEAVLSQLEAARGKPDELQAIMSQGYTGHAIALLRAALPA